MALNGTLSDLGIVDLIQFPHTGRKTGELIIASDADEARLYYERGALVHVRIGDITGVEGLVMLVSWVEGEFEFRMEVRCEERTVEMDLHRALMYALKTRDERAEKDKRDTVVPVSKGVPDGAAELLESLVVEQPPIKNACIISKEGEILAQATSKGPQFAHFDALLNDWAKIFASYPRAGLSRVFFEDEEGILHGCRLSQDAIVVLATGKELSMGGLSMTMNRLIAAIEAL